MKNFITITRELEGIRITDKNGKSSFIKAFDASDITLYATVEGTSDFLIDEQKEKPIQ